MEESYELYFGDDVVGEVLLSREGLYYHFRCRCKPFESNMYYVTLNSQKLGLLTPDGPWLRLDTKVAMKHLGEKPFRFYLLPKHAPIEKREFVPVYPEEPFAYLRRLENAILETRNNQTGILLQTKKM